MAFWMRQKMTSTRRIGITMRVVRSDYGEARDAIARDWPLLLESLHDDTFSPEWVLLPNIGEGCVSLARRCGIRGLLLTGGDDMGATPDRDVTENALLHWAAGEQMPVLGVCRGAQMLARYAGATLTELRRERHVAARHAVVWRAPGESASFWQQALSRPGPADVNSYHRWGLLQDGGPDDLTPVAVCPEDGSVEAFCHVSLPWMGIFWHPEREKALCPLDMALLHNLFADA